MGSAMKMLHLSDDPGDGGGLGLWLRLMWTSWQVLSVDAAQGVEATRAHAPDLLVLDTSGAATDSVALCQDVRAVTGAPLLLVSSRGAEEDVVLGLEAGADDYVIKPYRSLELQARLRALVRRTDLSHRTTCPYVYGDLSVDFEARRTESGGRAVKLTPTEFGLLFHLITNAPHIVTHEMLLSHVWGPNYASEREYVRVHINNLRQKLKDDPTRPQYIATEHGVGYRFLGPRPAGYQAAREGAQP